MKVRNTYIEDRLLALRESCHAVWKLLRIDSMTEAA